MVERILRTIWGARKLSRHPNSATRTPDANEEERQRVILLMRRSRIKIKELAQYMGVKQDCLYELCNPDTIRTQYREQMLKDLEKSIIEIRYEERKRYGW